MCKLHSRKHAIFTWAQIVQFILRYQLGQPMSVNPPCWTRRMRSRQCCWYHRQQPRAARYNWPQHTATASGGRLWVYLSRQRQFNFTDRPIDTEIKQVFLSRCCPGQLSLRLRQWRGHTDTIREIKTLLWRLRELPLQVMWEKLTDVR